MNFQAATTAIAMSHMCSGSPLLWLQGLVDDTPVAVLAETGASGDDIRLHLKDQSLVEVQVKKGVSGSKAFWDALLALCAAIARDDIGHGVLVVSPDSSAPVRDQLARDIIRLGQGRDDDLKAIGSQFKAKLLAKGMSVRAVSARLRIVTVHALESDTASVVAARSELARLADTSAPAWDAIYRDAHSLIEVRGRRTARTTLQMLAAANVPLKKASFAGLIAVEEFLAQRRGASASFSIPGLSLAVNVDAGWIPLKTKRIDRGAMDDVDLASALKRYHEGSGRSEGDEQFDAEATGWFVHPCVVVAGPGMGKSTLLKRLVRGYASDGQIALVARLAAIARRMEGGAGFQESLLELSLDSTGIRRQDLEAQGLDDITFLLDGLDECGRMQDAVAQALATFASAHPQTRIVLTTRPVGYATVHLSAWTHYELMSLAPDQALRNVQQVLGGVRFEAPGTLSEALSFARGEIGRGTFKLAVDTPLMVSMLGALAVRGMRLGATRADLYEQLLKLLQATPGTRTDRAAPSGPILRRFIALFGWASVRHPTATCDALMRECAPQLGRELGLPSLAGQDLCDACCQWWEAVGMLERLRFRGEETVTFTHKTFGEYCAALHVVELPEHEQQSFLSTSEAEPAWSETIDFACARGLADLAVSAALQPQRRGREEAEAVVRALRRAACASSALDKSLALQLGAVALKWISSANAKMAAEVGHALVEAAPKLPGIEREARLLQADAKSWTQLAAWACVIASQPTSVATGDLIRIVTAQRAPRQSDWALWQKVLLLAVKELVSREREPQVQGALAGLGQSRDVSVGTFIEIGEILAGAGLEMASSGMEDTTSEFVRETVSRGMPGRAALLDAMARCGGAVDPGVMRADAPSMHLSALMSAARLWGQPAGEIAAWAQPRWSKDAAPVLHAFATCVCVNLARVRAEAQMRLRQLRAAGQHGFAWGGPLHVDVRLQAPAAGAALAREVLEAGLVHRSNWTVALATQVIVWGCDEADRRSYAEFAFARSGTALWAACEIAASLPPAEAGILICANISTPAREGFQYLFDKLDVLHAAHPLALPVAAAESALLSTHVEVARSAAKFLSNVHAAGSPSVVASAERALTHWQATEGAYPIAFGVVPPSPRPELLKLLIANDAMTPEAALRLAGDPRPDVREVARAFLLARAGNSPDLVTTIIGQTLGAGLDPDILRFLLERAIPLSTAQAATLVEALRHAPAAIRIAALPLLRGPYLGVELRRSLAGELSSESEPEIQQAAHQLLDEL